ncbi:nucleotide exchange factor GrpE [Streptomyces sp. NBC_01775]|uniref:nucleotide exchange factor GrpE n=1 Tax=Streptomyces sp. NBC_01775 TaxID=2975939 RepID=UPI002DDC766F|nr:nucleotide exchange factor GrpE [Streptomyces sp. NBC_01775]WSB77866.1 nucleotide exchange factor GrpE [Streptomyces sp. NBC_01775]
MTEETPGFAKEPDVPADTGPAQTAASGKEAAAPGQSAGDAQHSEQAPHSEQDLDAARDMNESNGSSDIVDSAAADGTAPDGEAGEGDVARTAELDQTRTALHERTQDLQRLQAEFQNYRRRVERDRATVKEIAVANLLTELLPVLDDIGRARDHGELVGGFKSVAESLEMVAAKMGLMQFGKEGEPFDPTVHEALMHSYSPDVTETTCVQILQPGYRIGERTIRPARVGVAEPQPGTKGEGGDAAGSPEEENGGPDEG